MTDKKEIVRDLLAGGFFIAGIILIFIFLFTIGRDKGFSEPRTQIAVLFKDIGGLSEGAPVRLSGVNVGNVDAIEFLDKGIDGRRVKVVLNIYSRYRKQLGLSRRFSIKTEGILGEKLVEIYAVEEGQEPVDLRGPIIGEDPFDVQDLALVFAEAAQSFSKTAQEISKINMVELADVMNQSSRALLETSRGINEIMTELQEISRKSKRVVDRIEQKVIDGSLFKVF